MRTFFPHRPFEGFFWRVTSNRQLRDGACREEDGATTQEEEKPKNQNGCGILKGEMIYGT